MNQEMSWWKKEEHQSEEPAKRVSQSIGPSLIEQAPLQAGMEALGSLTAFLLQSRVTYTPKDFVVARLTPWIRAECPTKLWIAFERAPHWVSSGKNLCAPKLLLS